MKQLLFLLMPMIFFQSCTIEKNKNFKIILSQVKNLPIKTTNQPVAGAIIQNKPYIYSFGGLDSTKLYSGIHQNSFRYSILDNKWEQIESLPDSLGKIAGVASRIDDTIYIIGGYHVLADGSEKSSNKVHRFNIITNKFMQDGASLPVPIDDQVQVVWKNKLIYVITGWSNSENNPAVQIYNPKTNKWTFGTSVSDDNRYKSFGSSGYINEDTIFYFGGASMGKNYPIQNYLRKGVINKNKPEEITWSILKTDSVVGYRMGVMKHKNSIYWVGGSNDTYNYDGIAYYNKKGVLPNNRILKYQDGKFKTNFNKKIPMDLRGIAEISDSIKYIIGGLDEKQKVSNKVYKIEWKK